MAGNLLSPIWNLTIVGIVGCISRTERKRVTPQTNRVIAGSYKPVRQLERRELHFPLVGLNELDDIKTKATQSLSYEARIVRRVGQRSVSVGAVTGGNTP